MEIVTSPRRPRPSVWTRLLVGLCVAAPVTLLALLPVGLGLERFVLAGPGMEPSIARGSVLLERPVPVAALRVGDVITFRPPAGSGVDGLLTHRVLETRGSDVRTGLDASAARDPWVLPLDAPAPARVVASVPYLGHAYLVLGRPAVAGSLLALSAAAWLIVAAGARRRPGGGPDSRWSRQTTRKVGGGLYAPCHGEASSGRRGRGGHRVPARAHTGA
jgi:hypothetical protein